MFDRFLSLFRKQVSSAVTEGADEGLQGADLTRRVRDAVEEGVRDALDGLHKLLSVPPAEREKAEASNGKPHRTGKRLTARVDRRS